MATPLLGHVQQELICCAAAMFKIDSLTIWEHEVCQTSARDLLKNVGLKQYSSFLQILRRSKKIENIFPTPNPFQVCVLNVVQIILTVSSEYPPSVNSRGSRSCARYCLLVLVCD